MTGRVLAGTATAVTALIGLGIYLSTVGLDRADKIASVIGVFVALIGLGLALWGLAANRGGGQQRPPVSASGDRSVALGGDNTGVISTGDGMSGPQPR
ncbi:hypothetical protein [Acrocarpospora corrugata]|nr:hypothetical protein [Acrocarpospora corrugata]